MKRTQSHIYLSEKRLFFKVYSNKIQMDYTPVNLIQPFDMIAFSWGNVITFEFHY